MDDFRLLIRHTGGPDAIEREPIAVPSPGTGEVVVRHQAIGVNFIDTYQRGGLYPIALPSGLGSEAAGVVEATGEGVAGFRPGDRVAYAGGPLGAYATVRALPAEWLVRLPDAISAETAAAVLLKGQTVDMLVGPCAHVAAGQTVLVHAASGGVGSLLVPWLRSIGAIVIAHAGTDAKAERAKQLGANHSLSCSMDELAAHVRELTDGRGVEVVLDGVGQASWDASLASAAKRGLIVSYGNASGAMPPVPPLALTRAGSLFLTRPTLFDYLDSAEARQAAADRVFAKIAKGTLPAEIGRTFRLDEAAEAHRALEARQTVGSTVLTI
jgi:NADPH2:quinone reductase